MLYLPNVEIYSNGWGQGVCNTPNVGYFRESEVQRMCGICDMFGWVPPNDPCLVCVCVRVCVCVCSPALRMCGVWDSFLRSASPAVRGRRWPPSAPRRPSRFEGERRREGRNRSDA